MRFKIEKSTLLSAVSTCKDVTDQRSVLPVLHCIRLECENGKLTLSSTDLVSHVYTELPCKEDQPGDVTVRARELHAMLSKLPDGELSVSVDDKSRIELRSERAKFELPGGGAVDWPKEPDYDVSLSPADSAELALSKVLHAASTDASRQRLCGVYIETAEGRTSFVATDGHRMAVMRVEPLSDEDTSLILPAKGATLAVKRGIAGLGLCSDYAVFSLQDESVLSVKRVDGQFPSYRQVMPTTYNQRALVSLESLKAALDRAIAVGQPERGAVLEFSAGGLRIVADSPMSGGEYDETIDAEGVTEDLRVGVNPKYMLQALIGVDTEKVVIELGKDMAPVLITTDGGVDYRAAIMPMRV